ncbi:hypothetical protein SAMN04488121_11315 [Chitinophaga filiformis]|uniref:ABC-2 type transport system permease protein n=2 Tax=Chitinophaga filiformis TaxID=104663 RepID=A0A1G8CRK4_CHIFI|nr:hypothetical protein SAMN04488121_11315 [Chitinophaga filiformis]
MASRMISPLTIVLTKIFSRGFYRANAGSLLFFFVVVISYAIFITPAGTMSHDTFQLYELIVMMTLISNPVAMTAIFFAWLLYTLKSWQYVTGQLTVPENGFLYYSSTALSKFRQLRSWWWMQFVITLPITVYGLLSVIFGIVYHQYLLPFITILYLFLLITVSAALYVWLANRLSAGTPAPITLRLPIRWKKPFFSLFLYHIIHRIKLGGLLTKIFSLFCLASGAYSLFSGNRQDTRVAGLLVLTAVAGHLYLIYQEHRFEVMTLAFSRNFPYSRNRHFGYMALRYVLLLLPEMVFLAITAPSPMTFVLLAYAISVMLFFRSLLYWLGLNMNVYLPVVFAVYIVLFWLIMYGYLWQSAGVLLLLSYGLFYSRYYKLPPIE